jgi:peptide/nickel transport system ATP-binding protein
MLPGISREEGGEVMSEILRVEDLQKYFNTNRGELHAVDHVSFSINAGETLGVVGESGCGKSTLGRTILGLTPATGGKIIFDGKDITHAKGNKRKHLRKDMQIIFQDPFSSLNPRMSVMELIADPLKAYGICKNHAELEKRVYQLMDIVGLARRFAYSYPHELDGGRRQRIGVARALSLDPKFIVCDEPVSALDVSIQAQILNLLQDLQEERGLTYIFITHDLSVVKHISNDILVLYVGSMVEKCESKELFRNPLHPYTKGLLSAVPIPSIDVEVKRTILQGELSSPVNPKPGCRFAPRCPYATDQCRSVAPDFHEVSSGHFVACHRIGEINGI